MVAGARRAGGGNGPTEILAEAALPRFISLAEGLPVGSTSFRGGAGEERDAARAADPEGGDAYAVGTHALIQESVEFKNSPWASSTSSTVRRLQRAALREKAKISPHLLVMTATPIPRTLAIACTATLMFP
jgi:ATP-dependent DNA helicase RecG